MEERPPIWRVAVNKLNKQPLTADEGWSSSLGLDEMLTTPLRKKTDVKKYPLRWIFRKLEGVVGTGWSWLRIGTGGGHLWVR
jgi:hypothetical protein